MYPADEYAPRLLAEGAAAYLSKDRPPEDLVDTIRAVHAGRPARPNEALAGPGPTGTAKPLHTALSPREYQVFTLLFQGRTVSDIAAELDLAVSTVSNHVGHIREKLGVRTVGEIVGYAHRAGLVGTGTPE
jgi:DNA-binding NarL/FixJ family response regulator